MLPHAVGGAIALAYCTQEPRGTRDLDVNVFVARDRVDEVFGAMPDAVTIKESNFEEVARDGQTRLWWDETPIDVFLNVLPLHEEIAARIRRVVLDDRTIPVLDCEALAVFKAMFDRTQDWADIEKMVDARSIDVGRTAITIDELDGVDSHRSRRLRGLKSP